MDRMIISYMTLRKAVGILGMSLGFIVVLGGFFFGSGEVEGSISEYYLTNMRDIFVGVLFISGAFLLVYKGYDKVDNIITNITGISAIGVAIFPVEVTNPNNVFNLNQSWTETLHLISAIFFFVALSYMSYFQFTKTSGELTKQKKKRNLVYRICAFVILGNLVIGAFHMLFNFFDGVPYLITIIEIVMLLAFGVSWLVKGEGLLKAE